MSRSQRIRLSRLIQEAEGYLELDMPQHALDVLAPIEESGTFKGHLLYLRGEALRSLERYAEALEPLQAAAELNPSNIQIWLALGWCYKRSGRLDLAIEALEQAREVQPGLPLIHYNLACYWSLAGNKQRALKFLSRAIHMDPQFRDLIGAETDFDPLRNDPDFQALTAIIV